MNQKRTYLCIDLKSFYASVECVEKGLDSLETHLVVADESRTDKTICLAVSPSLKKYGIPGRLRLFELKQKIKAINEERRKQITGKFVGESYNEKELDNNPNLALTYICATPHMAHYIEISAKIYQIYLRFVAHEDIHVYSIDEVFMDITNYLRPNGLSAYEFTKRILKTIVKETKITATAGIGSNLYLAKVAMDIVAKHISADKDGVRIAQLSEKSYREQLWTHRPLTDFWRVGKGYARKLEAKGIYTMGDIARCSIGKFEDFYNEDLLYSMFGINAELLIDHAWGYETCTMQDIKHYCPSANSLSSSQVLPSPYSYQKAMLIVSEMADSLAMRLVEKGLVTDCLHLAVGYDIENLYNENKNDVKEIKKDSFGRDLPKGVHAGMNLNQYTSSGKIFRDTAAKIFTSICDKKMLVRRLSLSALHVIKEEINKKEKVEQGNLFSNNTVLSQEKYEERLKREKREQKTILAIKKKYGKNSILKVRDLEEGATEKLRNEQIGGHKA